MAATVNKAVTVGIIERVAFNKEFMKVKEVAM